MIDLPAYILIGSIFFLGLPAVLLWVSLRNFNVVGFRILAAVSLVVAWIFFQSFLRYEINRSQFRSMVAPINMRLHAEEPLMLQGQQIGVKVTVAVTLPKDVKLDYHGNAVLEALLQGPQLQTKYLQDASSTSFFPVIRATTSDARLIRDIPTIAAHLKRPYGQSGDGSVILRAGTYQSSADFWFPGLTLPDGAARAAASTHTPCKRVTQHARPEKTEDFERATYAYLGARVSIQGPNRRGPYEHFDRRVDTQLQFNGEKWQLTLHSLDVPDCATIEAEQQRAEANKQAQRDQQLLTQNKPPLN